METVPIVGWEHQLESRWLLHEPDETWSAWYRTAGSDDIEELETLLTKYVEDEAVANDNYSHEYRIRRRPKVDLQWEDCPTNEVRNTDG